MSDKIPYEQVMERMKSDIGYIAIEAYQSGYKDCETKYCSFDACRNRQAEYQRGLNDAWLFASHLAYVSDSVTDNIYISANGGKGLLVAFGMTYEEAKKTYDEYFDKKQESDEIKIGDVVFNVVRKSKGIVISVSEDSFWVWIPEYDSPQNITRVDNWIRTGVSHPEITEWFKAMKGEQ